MLGERDIEALGEGEEEGGYIEMELGLGVLEERSARGGREGEMGRGSGSGSGSEGGSGSGSGRGSGSGSGSEDEGKDDGVAAGEKGEARKDRPDCAGGGARVGEKGRRKERSVLGKLMGWERRRARPGIHVL